MRERDWRTKPRSRGGRGPRHSAPRERQTDVVLYGWHTVTAALANPNAVAAMMTMSKIDMATIEAAAKS